MNACPTHGQFAAWMNQCPKCLIGAKAAPEPAKPLPESAPLVKPPAKPLTRRIYKRRAEMTQLVIPLRRTELEALRNLAHAKGLRPATWARMFLLTQGGQSENTV